MRIATIEIETDGLRATARTTEVWEGEPLVHEADTAWGALHGMADQLEKIAKGRSNPQAVVTRIARIVVDPNLHGPRGLEALQRIRQAIPDEALQEAKR